MPRIGFPVMYCEFVSDGGRAESEGERAERKRWEKTQVEGVGTHTSCRKLEMDSGKDVFAMDGAHFGFWFLDCETFSLNVKETKRTKKQILRKMFGQKIENR